MKIFQFITFITIALSIYFGMHYYAYSRIADAFALPLKARYWLRFAFLLAALSFVISEILTHNNISGLAKLPIYAGMIWLGIITISTAVFFTADIVWLFHKTPAFRQSVILWAIFFTAVLSLYSLLNGIRSPIVKNLQVSIKNLPKDLAGFRIVQLSDLHINALTNTKKLESLVKKVNGLNPDIIVITGDLIDADFCKLDHFCETLKRLSSKYGTYAVTGNHEFYSGIPLFEKIAKLSDITLLRNSHVKIGCAIELAGIDDQSAHHGHGDDLAAALKGIDTELPVILLSHQPDIFDRARKAGVGLQLSGHTHAGQIPPMDLLVNIFFKYPYGLYKKGESYIYTSCGTYYWGPPMRLFTKPEIVLVTLD